MTFDLKAFVRAGEIDNWVAFEAFGACRRCKRSTTFLLRGTTGFAQNSVTAPEGFKNLPVVDGNFEVVRFLSLRDVISQNPPEHLPTNVEAVFREGAACMAIGCNNAAATMFRLCVDIGTRELLPPADYEGADKPNSKQRRDLGLRLPWLFDTGRLPEALRDLAHCIKEDGNDGAHAGTLTEHDVEDLIDFTNELLERLYTEPEKLRLAKERRDARRAVPQS